MLNIFLLYVKTLKGLATRAIHATDNMNIEVEIDNFKIIPYLVSLFILLK